MPRKTFVMVIALTVIIIAALIVLYSLGLLGNAAVAAPLG